MKAGDFATADDGGADSGHGEDLGMSGLSVLLL
jgi:hypothetical protein